MSTITTVEDLRRGLEYDRQGKRVILPDETDRYNALVEQLRKDGFVINPSDPNVRDAGTDPSSGKISIPPGNFFVSEMARVHALLHEVGHALSGIGVKENNKYGLRPFDYTLTKTFDPNYVPNNIKFEGGTNVVHGIMPFKPGYKDYLYENHREELIADATVKNLLEHYKDFLKNSDKESIENFGDKNISIALKKTTENIEQLKNIGLDSKENPKDKNLLIIIDPKTEKELTTEEVRRAHYLAFHKEPMEAKHESNAKNKDGYVLDGLTYNLQEDINSITSEADIRLDDLKKNIALIKSSGIEYIDLRKLFTWTDPKLEIWSKDQVFKKPYLEDMQKGVDDFNKLFDKKGFTLKNLVKDTNALQRELYLPNFIEIINKHIGGADLSSKSAKDIIEIYNNINKEVQIEFILNKDTRDATTNSQTIGEMIVEMFGGKVSDQFGNEKVSFQPESTVEKPKVWGSDIMYDIVHLNEYYSTVNTGTRSDTIHGYAGSDHVWAGAGNDLIIGNGGNDYLYGEDGSDVIFGGGESFYGVDATDGNNFIVGGNGRDILVGGGGDDIIHGGDVDDHLLTERSAENGDWLIGGAGNDTLLGSASDDFINGGAGDDTVYGGAGNDIILGDGHYHPLLFTTVLDGTGGSLVYEWTVNADGNKDINRLDFVHILGINNFNWQQSIDYVNASFEIIPSKNGMDGTHLVKNGGNDALYGGSGDDFIAGQTGDDIIFGGDGNDIIFGDDFFYIDNPEIDGNDLIYGGKGADKIFGGGGNDIVYAGDYNESREEGRLDKDQDILYGGKGDDILHANGGGDLLYGEDGDDVLYAADDAKLYGGAGNDHLYALDANNILLDGGEGNDTFFLGSGSNVDIKLGSGNNILYFGTGKDHRYDASESSDNTFRFHDGVFSEGGTTTVSNDSGKWVLYFNNNYITANHLSMENNELRSNQQSLNLGEDYRIVIRGNDLVIEAKDPNLTGKIMIEGGAKHQSFTELWDQVKENHENGNNGGGTGNRAPVIDEFAVDTNLNVKDDWSYQLSDALFKDPDGDKLTYAVTLADGSALPSWLIFDPITLTLSGIAGVSDVGALNLKVVATDPAGLSAEQFFNLNILREAIKGDDTDNIIIGTPYDDTIYGYGGNDSLHGANGNDTIYGGDGNDEIHGGKGNDILYGEVGDDIIYGNADDDYIDGGDGNDKLYGGDGNDFINGGNGDDYIEGGDGNDFINGGNGDDYIEGGDGDDSLHGANGNDIIYGGNGNDEIHGGKGDDMLHGEAGDDVIYGNAGDDYIDGGTGNDELYGGDGNDKLYGANGDDIIYGGTGNDEIHGGKGDDTLYGEAGNDVIYGNAGDDYINGGTGNDELYGGDGDDSLHGANGDDIIYGGNGNDEIHGGKGDDTLYGEAGNDVIYGNAGDDVLIGGKGSDYLVGGAGNDTYQIRKGDGADEIVNFAIDGATATDLLQFEGINSTDALFTKEGNHLVITYSVDKSDRVQLTDFFLGANYEVDLVQFVDKSYSASELKLMTSGKQMSLMEADALMGYAQAPTANQELHSLISAMASFDSTSNEQNSMVTNEFSLTQPLITSSY